MLEDSSVTSIKQVLQAVSLQAELRVDTIKGEEWDSWRTALRSKLWELLGGRGERVAPCLATVARYRKDGYTRSLLRYHTEPGVTAAAWLLEPDTGPGLRPGFLALHGHGRGKDDVLGLTEPDDVEAQEHIRAHKYDYATHLVRRGYVVLAPDARGFGETSADGCHVPGLVSLYLGRPVVGQRVWDDSVALDILADLPGVDARRLACGGLSEGGKRTLFLAALDERIQAAVISGYFTSLSTEIAAWDRLAIWDICNAVPGLLRWADLPDVAALIAPRHLVIENGRDDPLYTLDGVRTGFETLQWVWQALDAKDRLSLHLFDGVHRWNGGATYQNLDDALNNQSPIISRR